MSSGQVSLDSLTEDAEPPVKAQWVSRPRCGQCGVWLCKGIINEKGIISNVNERVCAGCGAVNRLD